MKNRHRVSQVVSKLIYSRAARRKILKQGAADCGEYRQACSHLGIPPIAKPYATAPAAWRYSPLSAAQRTPKVRLIAASFLGRQRSASALSVGAVFQLTVVKPILPQARTACLDRSCMTCEGQ